jgi:vitamin B12 transporter
LSYQFNDDRTDSFYNNNTFANELVVLESFGVLDYYISHQVNDHLKIFAGVNNLTNEKYEEIYRFNTMGRNARFGLALNF